MIVCQLPLPPAAAGAAQAQQPNAAALPRPAAPAGLPGAKPKAHMPAPLRLDDQGREVDEFGRPIERDTSRVAAPSLKVRVGFCKQCVHPVPRAAGGWRTRSLAWSKVASTEVG